MLRLHAAVPWAAVEVLLLLCPAVLHASLNGWPLDGFGARYGESYGSGGYGERFLKGFGDRIGHGVYGDGFGGYGLRRYGEGYGGAYSYGGGHKDWLEDWPGSFFEDFPSRKNTAPAKYSTGDTNFDFLGAPKYNFAFGADDYIPSNKHGHDEYNAGEKVVGVYTLKEPGGHVRTIQYIADDAGGFQATVVNSDGDFNGAAYVNGYGYGPTGGGGGGDSGVATLAEVKHALGSEEALQPWSGWAEAGGDGGGGSWHGLWGRLSGGGGGGGEEGSWGAYNAGPLVGGYAVHEQPKEGYV